MYHFNLTGMLNQSRAKSFSFKQQPSPSLRDNRSSHGRKKRYLSFHLPAKHYNVSMDDSNSGESSVGNDIQTYHHYGNHDTMSWNPEVIDHKLNVL